MDIDDIIASASLVGEFPIPALEPFTYRQALDAGVTRHQLTRLVKAGLLRRPLRQVYLATEAGDSLAVRAACLRLVVPQDCVVVDRHAGWLLGAQMILRPGEHLDLRPLSLFRPSGHGRLRNDLSASGERNLSVDDVMEIGGLQVTTPIRTAWDLGRVRWTDDAISGLDAMFRLGSFTMDEFLDGIERFRGMRWVTTLRAIGPLADGRSESPGESVLRLRCIEAQVHVVPQVEIYGDGALIARLDLANEDLLLGFEYDGDEWHSTPEQLEHDRTRRRDVAERGWLPVALRSDDVFGRQRLCDRIIREAAHEARVRRGLRVTGSAQPPSRHLFGLQ
ncbi:type IV toxin-antitoxin system AbiEi family antitoxin domain-containing protein [Nocardioides aquiterrae]|uniref:AbiEi antitoxin N-terminal domain-containing protein n=1 Tax=Nocardioides aquiterrae TaxID=203799 RepID=A0ABP4F8A7_9ACTN